ncbi:MAG: hypothetical protein ACYTBJ_17835 [Planctomycetota bacterium]|jgi:hypothetical protein
MDKLFCVLVSSVFSITIWGFVGCSTTPATTGPTYPALSEIPPVPSYAAAEQSWDTNAVCWVGIADDANWNNIGPPYAEAQFSATIVPLVQEELRNEGYQVKTFDNDYITRNERLSIHRIILCKEFQIKKTMVREGACYDMKLTLNVINNPQQERNTQCEVWGRLLSAGGEVRPWVEVYKECVCNLGRMHEFRKALEVDAPI